MKKSLKRCVTGQFSRWSIIRHLKFRWKLNSLHSERERISAAISSELAKATKEQWTSDELSMFRAGADNDEQLIQGEIDSLVSNYWAEAADRLFIPLPSRREDGMWEHYPLVGRWYLTNRGISVVRESVRKEQIAKYAIWEKLIGAAWTILIAYLGYRAGKG